MVAILPLTTTETDRIKNIFFKMFDILKFHELVKGPNKNFRRYYRKTLMMLKNGSDLFYIRISYKNKLGWIHIESKTLARLKMYGETFLELFLRASENMSYLQRVTHKINVTIINRQDKAKIDF